MPVNNLADACKQAVVALIGSLPLDSDDPGFTLNGPYTEIDLDTSNVTMPCWLVTSDASDREELLPGDSEWRQWILPLRLLLKDRRGPKDHSRDGQYRAWRQRLIDAFHQRRTLSDRAAACYWHEVKTDLVYDRNKAEFQDIQSALGLRLWLREPRYADVPLPSPLVPV